MKKVNRDKLGFYLWGRFETIDAIVEVGLINKIFKMGHTHNLNRKSITTNIHPHEFQNVVEMIKNDVKDENLLFFLEYFVGICYQDWKEIEYKNFSLKSVYKKCLKDFRENKLPFRNE